MSAEQREDLNLEQVLEDLRYVGYALVPNVLGPELIEQIRVAMYATKTKIVEEVGEERLKAAGELGVLRLACKYDPVFLRLLELPQVLQVIDATVSPTAIMHLQNGFILPSFAGKAPAVFQNAFHQDFPRVLNGYLMSINVMFAIDDFTADNGATLVVPGTHQRVARPDPDYLLKRAIPVTCKSGSMFVFDSTLYHAAGHNVSGRDRLAINHQFTRSYLKQQIDYVRALGPQVMTALPPRTQQLLGWYTRVVTSLDEYYRSGDNRLYRAGQG